MVNVHVNNVKCVHLSNKMLTGRSTFPLKWIVFIHNILNLRILHWVLKYLGDFKTVENRLVIFNGAIQVEKHDDTDQDTYQKDSN